MGGIVSAVGDVVGGIFGNNKDNFDKTLAGMGPGARPDAPKFQGLTNEDGTLKSQFSLGDGSQYSALAKAQLDQNVANARDAATNQASGANAAAQAQLAQRGGIGAGQRLMLSQQNDKNMQNAQQNVTNQQIQGSNQNALNQFNITQGNKKFDTSNLIGNQQNLNNFNQEQYKQQMANWSAQATGQDQFAASRRKGQSGGIGGIIGSITGK